MEQKIIVQQKAELKFLLPFMVLAIIIAVLIEHYCSIYDVDKSFKGAIVGGFFTFSPQLYNNIESYFMTETEKKLYYSATTKPFIKTLFLFPLKILGLYMIFSISSGIIILIKHYFGYIDPVSDMKLMGILSVITGLFITIIMYILGEQLGRNLANHKQAILVAIIGAAFTYISYWIFSNYTIIEQVKHILEEGQLEILKQVIGWATVIGFLSICVPLIFGAYRGSKYKKFFDLAYFTDQLPIEKKKEVFEYINLIEEEYKQNYKK